MSTFDTTRWYKHEYHGNSYRPLVSKPDSEGGIPVVDRSGSYKLLAAAHLTLAPDRHTVELRLPEVGERCFYASYTASAESPDRQPVWVIVDDEVTS